MSELQYGLRDGKIVSIWDLSEEDRGLKCNCTCPNCGMPLQAKLGTGKKERHFAHNNANCNIVIAQQTALHLLAKEIIEEYKTVRFPPIIVPFEQTNLCKSQSIDLRQYNLTHSIMLPHKIEYKSATTVNFQSVLLEKRVSTIIPDIIAFIGNKTCLIEIAVTHFVDENKETKIKELNLPVLEIDISSLNGEILNKETLKDIICNQIDNKKWIYNPLFEDAISFADKEYQRIFDENEENLRRKKLQEQKSEEQKKKRREDGQKALEKALMPENYCKIINDLRNDITFYKIYQNLWIYKESKKPPFYLDIPICGEFIFNCDRRIWQSHLFYIFVYKRHKNDFGQMPISYDRIINWIKNHQDKFLINWDFSYKTVINDMEYNLLHDVIYYYLSYLTELGFIKHEYTSYNDRMYVAQPYTLIPPNKEYAAKLKMAIDNVNGALPDANEQIDNYINNSYNTT